MTGNTDGTALGHGFAGDGAGSITIDLGAHPWLTDHRVRGVGVAPGAVYISALISESATPSPLALENVEFHALAPLTQRALQFSTSVRGTAVEMQQTGSDGHSELVANLRISSNVSVPPTPIVTGGDAISGPALYDRLRASGNDYGERFRGLTAITRSGDSSEAGWLVPGAS